MDTTLRSIPAVEIRRAMAWLMVAIALLVWPAFGNPTAYLVLVLALIATPFTASGRGIAWLLTQSWIRLWLISFVMIAVAFTLNAQDAADYGHILDFIVLPLAIPIALLALLLGPKFNALRLAQFCLASAIVAGIVALYVTFVLHAYRASGYELSPIQFADLAVIVGFMALGGFFVGDGKRNWYLLAGPLFGVMAAMLAGTRGALLVAAVLGAVFIVFFVLRHRSSTRKKFMMLGALVAIAAAVLAIGDVTGSTRFFDALTVLGNLASGKEVDSSSAYRLEMLASGWRAFLDAPIYGHGWAKQLASALPYMSEMGREGYELEKWGYIHNEALSFAVGGGGLGLIAYMIWMIAPFIGLRSVPNDTQADARAYFVFTLVGGLVVAGLTEVLFMSELSKTLMIVLVSVILLACRDASPIAKPSASMRAA